MRVVTTTTKRAKVERGTSTHKTSFSSSVTQKKTTQPLSRQTKVSTASVVTKTITPKKNTYKKRVKRFLKLSLKSILLSPSFHSSIKMVMIALIISGMGYTSYRFITKTFANEVIVSQSEIVARVNKLTMLPVEDPYEIVRVQDEEDLRKQNSFYKDVKEGDYILVYKDMAVIYDLRDNTIVAIKKAEKRAVQPQ
jgi:hypothetical protein